MKHIIIVLTLIAISACSATPQGGVAGQAPAAGDYNPITGMRTGR